MYHKRKQLLSRSSCYDPDTCAEGCKILDVVILPIPPFCLSSIRKQGKILILPNSYQRGAIFKTTSNLGLRQLSLGMILVARRHSVWDLEMLAPY